MGCGVWALINANRRCGCFPSCSAAPVWAVGGVASFSGRGEASCSQTFYHLPYSQKWCLNDQIHSPKGSLNSLRHVCHVPNGLDLGKAPNEVPRCFALSGRGAVPVSLPAPSGGGLH